MVEARAAASAILLADGHVLVAGGHTGSGLHSAALSSADLYDPINGTWSRTADLMRADAYMSATLLPSGRVLVLGGYENDMGTPYQAELYDPGSKSWSPTGTPPFVTTGPSATLLLDGRVLVAGGTNTGTPSFMAELYVDGVR